MAHVRRKLAQTKQHDDSILVLLERSSETKNPFTQFTIKKSDWLAHREFVLQEWIIEHAGTRPLYWWLYDAPEARRKQVEGTENIIYRALDHDKNWRFNRKRKTNHSIA